MKTLILALVALSGFSAQAGEYWKTHCDVTGIAKDFVVAAYPGTTLDADKQCSRVAYMVMDYASCIQSTVTTVEDFFGSRTMDYQVIVKSEQNKSFDVRISAENDGNDGCRATKVELVGILE
jgi:hypothetical protein